MYVKLFQSELSFQLFYEDRYDDQVEEEHFHLSILTMLYVYEALIQASMHN